MQMPCRDPAPKLWFKGITANVSETLFDHDMTKQASRRRLVVLIYASLAALLAAGWFVDRLNTSGICVCFAAMFVNLRIFGGY
jgi:hypothetical protein